MKNVKFVPGKKLNRLFFEKKVKPLLKKYFPQLNYSAALIGYGSDVLGYDTPISRDHNWGPRLQLFLSEKSYIKYYEEIDFKLKNNLPQIFMGYSVITGTTDLISNFPAPVSLIIGELLIFDSFRKEIR